MKKLIVLGMLGLLAGAVQAERADSTKEVVVDADRFVLDDVKQITTLFGNVVLTRGTMVVKAGRAVATKSAAGDDFVTLYAAPGGTVTFRQKRDGGPDMWVDGQAERVEYDGKTELVQLFNKARLKQTESGRTTNEVNGDFISYNSRTEIFSGNARSDGESVPGTGRVRIILTPAKTAPAPAPAKSGAK
jgi:lipopolysaccharide export system protein LptA